MIISYIEIRDNKIKKASLEALGEAQRTAEALGMIPAAALVGNGVEGLAAEVMSHGAARVYVLENPAFARYSTQDHAQALAGLAAKVKPFAVFFSATAQGKDLAPRLAARLGVGLASDCTRLAVNGGVVEYTRPIFAGKALLTMTLNASPQIASLRPNVFPLAPPAAAAGEVIRETAGPAEARTRAEVTEIVGGDGGEIDVAEADIIVSGGRGMKGPENFELLRELARLLPRAAVGASRSAVDSGWIGHQHQVGQTGKTVSPNLYLAFGISGAIQHVAGISSSKFIVAVNKDAEAPIFKVADFGAVGDLFEIIPLLRDEIEKLRAE